MGNYSEVEAGKKPFYKKVWFWIIVIVVLIIIGATASGGNKDSNNSSAKQPSTSNKIETKEFYALGEEGKLGNGAIMVTKVEKSNGTQYNKAKEGKEFVIVYVTIKNTGKENLSYNPYYFKVQNSQGQQESQTISLLNNDTALNSGELISGGSVSGTMVFEEPKDDTDLTLIYQDNLWSSQTLKLKLQ